MGQLNSLAARVPAKRNVVQREVQKGKDVFNVKSLCFQLISHLEVWGKALVFSSIFYPGSRQITHSSKGF